MKIGIAIGNAVLMNILAWSGYLKIKQMRSGQQYIILEVIKKIKP